MTTTQVVRPAGAGHETLYVLLLCLIILAVAGSVIALHGESQEVAAVPSHQLDARRDLSAAEQGIYADLRVTLEEIQLRQSRSAASEPPGGDCRCVCGRPTVPSDSSPTKTNRRYRVVLRVLFHQTECSTTVIHAPHR